MPTPWNGRRGARRFPRLAHEHGELRAAMRRLDMAVSQPACPPPGHAFLGLVQTLAAFFPAELAGHAAAEEAELYPLLAQALGDAEVAALVAEHAELQGLAVGFQAAAQGPVGPNWGLVRQRAICLSTALRAHLHHEEAAIDCASQARG